MTRTVKVRVAVAVNAKGDWHALGWCYGNRQGHEAAASDALSTVRLGMPSGPLSVAWLTADLPVPEPAEVEATAEGRTP